MTPGECCSDTLELSTFQAALMHAGEMKRLGTNDEAAGWQEVRRGLDRLEMMHEKGFYTTTRPASE